MATMRGNVVNPAQAIECLLDAIAANGPIMLSGGPGLGKSDVTRQVSDRLFAEKYASPLSPEQRPANCLTAAFSYRLEERKYNGGKEVVCICNETNEEADRPWFIDFRASMLTPVDFRGIPGIDKERNIAKFYLLDIFPTDPRGGIFFCDEITQAEPDVQNPLLQLVLDRRLGDYRMPKAWIPMAAGNRTTDGTYSVKMSKALGSRWFSHLTIEADLNSWITDWALLNGIRPEVIAFLRLRPQAFYQFDPKSDANSFPCPRVWAAISRMLSTVREQNRAALFCGALGDGIGIEFCTFLKLLDRMISVDEIERNPHGARLPEDVSISYAVASALAHAATLQNVEKFFVYMSRLSEEFLVLWIRDIQKKHPELLRSDSLRNWAQVNGHYLV